MDRWHDWLRQAKSDAAAARNLHVAGNWDWTCFAAHQASEKALKALLEHHGADRGGHNLNLLVREIEALTSVPDAIRGACARLNRMYIPTRYPDAYDEGAPVDQYREEDARSALDDMDTVVGFVLPNLPSAAP